MSLAGDSADSASRGRTASPATILPVCFEKLEGSSQSLMKVYRPRLRTAANDECSEGGSCSVPFCIANSCLLASRDAEKAVAAVEA